MQSPGRRFLKEGDRIINLAMRCELKMMQLSISEFPITYAYCLITTHAANLPGAGRRVASCCSTDYCSFRIRRRDSGAGQAPVEAPNNLRAYTREMDFEGISDSD